MERVVLKAEYRTLNVFNEGYICISKNDGGDERIEGVFGLDYVKIQFTSKNTFDLILYEYVMDFAEDSFSNYIGLITFQSQKLSFPELSCPDVYQLTSKTSRMTLKLLRREDSKNIGKIFSDLEKVRQ